MLAPRLGASVLADERGVDFTRLSFAAGWLGVDFLRVRSRRVPPGLFSVTTRAQRDQVRQRIGISTIREARDVVNLELLRRAATSAAFAIASACCRSRHLPAPRGADSPGVLGALVLAATGDAAGADAGWTVGTTTAGADPHHDNGSPIQRSSLGRAVTFSVTTARRVSWFSPGLMPVSGCATRLRAMPKLSEPF